MANKNRSITKERSYFIAKDNSLITKSRYSLSLQQHKILLYLISRIKPTDSKNTIYEFEIKHFLEVCGYSINSFYWTSIKNDIKELSDISNWIEIEKGKEVLFRWIDTAEINKNQGLIKISFHSSVAQYLFDLRERYTQYSLYNVLCLSHKYSIRLYEYLYSMRYKKRFEVSIEELKTRIDAENYNKFSHFKDRVLIPAFEEINSITNIDIKYEFKKTGRTITDIAFEIKEKDSIAMATVYMKQKGYLK